MFLLENKVIIGDKRYLRGGIYTPNKIKNKSHQQAMSLGKLKNKSFSHVLKAGVYYIDGGDIVYIKYMYI